MHLDDFDYELPQELIAQQPPVSRENSRLMVLDRQSENIATGGFGDILRHFRVGDVLVVNDTRVIPARLLGVKESGGKIEVFLVRRYVGENEVWSCLTRCSKPPRPGSRLLLGEGLVGTVVEGGESPLRDIRFEWEGDFWAVLETVGHVPLPPYIQRSDSTQDKERYQTLFARHRGALAAPTAGLHFSESVIDGLRDIGVEICSLTLHVGLGTFLPVRVDDIRTHQMHRESYCVPEQTAQVVNRAKAEGRRVFALGTTTTRTLEHAVDQKGQLCAGAGESDLFIYPGFQFRIVDALITNLHLPKSTLLMLVSAFAGQVFVKSAYQRAVDEKFRFFSYGDCMLIL